MKKSFSYVSRTLAVVGLLVSPALFSETLDGIVATVDQEVILQSDVLQEIGPMIQEMKATAGSQEAFNQEVERAFNEGLNQAIEYKILYREAALAGVEIPEEDVERRLEHIKKQYESTDAFMKAIEDAGESMADFRDRMRKQIMAISMGMKKREDFEAEAVVSEAEMAAYYEAHQSEYVRPERMKVRRLFISADKDPRNRKKALARLASLQEELALGADFGALAKSYSQGPEAADGGLIGWVQRGDLVVDLEKEAFGTPVNGLSKVVETEWGYHLLKVEAREEAGVKTFDEARTDIEPVLRAQRGEERYRKWMDDLRERSRVHVFK